MYTKVNPFELIKTWEYLHNKYNKEGDLYYDAKNNDFCFGKIQNASECSLFKLEHPGFCALYCRQLNEDKIQLIYNEIIENQVKQCQKAYKRNKGFCNNPISQYVYNSLIYKHLY